MNILLFFLGVLIPWLMGGRILFAVTKGMMMNPVNAIAISYGLGIGTLAFIMLFIGMTGISYEPLVITLCVVAVSLCQHVIALRQKRFAYKFALPSSVKQKEKASGRSPWQRGNILRAAALIFIAYYLYCIFWVALNLPVHTWDSVATSVFNAKILYFERSLDSQHYFAHKAYPLQLPMIIAWLAMCWGAWTDQLIKILFPLAFSMFALIFYDFLRSKTDGDLALSGIILFFSSNLVIYHAGISYRDIFMMYYLCTSVFLLCRWQETAIPGLLVLASLFAGFAGFLKLEGGAYILILTVVTAYIMMRDRRQTPGRKARTLGLFIAPAVLPNAVYSFYKWLAGLPAAEYIGVNWHNALHRMLPVFRDVFGQVFLTANWSIVWLFALIAVIFSRQQIRRDISRQVILLTILLFFGLHITLAVVSEKGNHVISPFTFARLLIHVFPLAVTLVVLFLKDLKGKNV